jgi:hypothetical protein
MSELPAHTGREGCTDRGRRGFAFGLVVALPLSLVAWLIFFWMV